MELRQTTATVWAILSVWLLPAQAGDGQDIAKHLQATWTRTSFYRQVTVSNPAVSSEKRSASERLSLHAEVDVRMDPNLVLGISREAAITRATGPDGRTLSIPASPSPSPHGPHYSPLRYSRRYVQPKNGPGWWRKVRSVLPLPQKPPPRPRLVHELRPPDLQIDLGAGLLEEVDGKVRVEGYFHALLAESIEHVDVPFEPNDRWVRLTPGVRVRIVEARSTGRSYHYRIEASPSNAGMSMVRLPRGPLPQRVPVGKQLLDSEGKPLRHGMHHMTGHISGTSSGSGIDGTIDKIRFLIAVKPAERKVPFEFKDVLIPDPNE